MSFINSLELKVFSYLLGIFIKKEDLIINFLGKPPRIKNKVLLIFFANILFYLYLFNFYKILLRFPFLKIFTCKKGIEPKYFAYLFIFLSLFWLFREFFIKTKVNPNKQIIEYFIKLLNNKKFPDFYEIFTRYIIKKDIIKHWNWYKIVILNPKFLKKVIKSKPYYILNFWPLFSTEKVFRQIFELFLINKNSSYYIEIKENKNSSCIQEDKPFLKTVIIDNLKQSIDNSIFLILTDYIRQDLKNHNNLQIYNQEHYFPRVRENESNNLPIYYHIRFIDLLYSYAIHSNIDISTISKKYTNQPSIFSSIIALIIENLSLSGNTDLKYSTNYHWLIKEIFHIQSEWIQKIGCSYDDDDNFNIDNSYISFIPTSIQLCLKELYKGIEKQKIDIDFLNEIISENVFNYYFNSCFDLTIKKEIDKKILKTIPSVYKNTIINYSINKILGLSLDYSEYVLKMHKNRNDLNNLKQIINEY